MNSEGRRILYRVSMRCAVEWGSALARVDQENSPPHLSQQPFESESWHTALFIVDCLYQGNPFPGWNILKARINGR